MRIARYEIMASNYRAITEQLTRNQVPRCREIAVILVLPRLAGRIPESPLHPT